MAPAKRRATYEDLATLPAEARDEILAGELVTLPAPRATPKLVIDTSRKRLRQYDEAAKGGR